MARSFKSKKFSNPSKKGDFQRREREEYSEDIPIPAKHLQNFLDRADKSSRKAIASWLHAAKDLSAQHQSAPVPNGKPELDPWQKEAYEALIAGKNVVVDAPTTAGKTRVVETLFSDHLQNSSFRAAYTTPVKSLSNDKLREFRAMFGRENVGIATGDVKDNLSAPIVVTTLETYRNSLLGVEPDLNRSIVVFDEYHFMQDESRGSAWEEAIILTPPNCQLLLMSASVDNAADFVNWIGKIHPRPTVLIQTTHRPVPLTNVVYVKDRWILAEEIADQLSHDRKKREPLPIPHKILAPRLTQLLELELTPTIIYAGRRKSVVSLAAELAKNLEPLPLEAREAIGEVLLKEQGESKALSFLDQSLRHMMQTYGVAYHHSGMPAPARVAVEAILKQGLLRFCTATMGLSIGINFSVRSTLISDYTRPGERGLSRYGASEILQMLGRAGRRGRDVIGFSLWPNVDSYQKMSLAKRDRCVSKLKNDPTTLLGLISQGRNEKELENFYSKSFLRFNDTGIDLGIIRRSRIESRLGTKELPCSSPAHAFARFSVDENDPETQCKTCQYRKECHRYIETKVQNDLAALYLHLHMLKALNQDDQLSTYGMLAKYIPQTGGLVLAKYIELDLVNADNLGAGAELMAGLSLARHKSPSVDTRYRFPFPIKELEEDLEIAYPITLFPELYDEPFGKRNFPVLREYNPDGGYVIRQWVKGTPWRDLCRMVTNDKFAEGDLMSLIYRVATYLQSIVQADQGDLSKAARGLREQMLREPLSISI